MPANSGGRPETNGIVNGSRPGQKAPAQAKAATQAGAHVRGLTAAHGRVPVVRRELEPRRDLLPAWRGDRGRRTRNAGRGVDAGDPAVTTARHFLGSPTLRVDGRDIDPRCSDPGDYTPQCRIYWTPEGLRGVSRRGVDRGRLVRMSGRPAEAPGSGPHVRRGKRPRCPRCLTSRRHLSCASRSHWPAPPGVVDAARSEARVDG